MGRPYSIQDIKDFFHKGDTRSVQLKKSIVSCLFIKVISVIISLLMVPMCIHYINAEQYGIWLTLSTMVFWLGFFDIGLSNGLRNKFAEAKAKGDSILAREYVSTTFFMLTLIFVVIWLFFVIGNNFINWNKFFHLGYDSVGELNNLFVIIISYFCLQNVIKILSTIFISDQHPAWASFFDMLGQFLALLIIWVMMQLIPGSLMKLGIVLCFAPLLVWVIANIIFFRGRYKMYSPSIKYVKFICIKDILNLGLQFFIIQISCIIQFQTANFIIAYYFSVLDVTIYNIVYKYFNVLAMTFTIFLAPFWSAVTDAWTRKEFEWIRNATRKYLLIAMAFTFLGVVLMFVAPCLLKLWVGEVASGIDLRLIVICFIYVAITLYTTLYVNILNGMGILRVQYILALISPFVYLGASYFLINYWNLGTYSIYIALILSNINGYVAPFQYYRLMREKRNYAHLKTMTDINF